MSNDTTVVTELFPLADGPGEELEIFEPEVTAEFVIPDPFIVVSVPQGQIALTLDDAKSLVAKLVAAIPTENG